MSEPFQVFNTGNRNKFLQNAKKKKNKTNEASQEQRKCLKIQKNIRRYLTLKRASKIQIQNPSNYDIFLMSQQSLMNSPFLLLQNILQPHKLSIIDKKLSLTTIKYLMLEQQAPQLQQVLFSQCQQHNNNQYWLNKIVNKYFWAMNSVELKYFVVCMMPLGSYCAGNSLWQMLINKRKQVQEIVRIVSDQGLFLRFVSRIQSGSGWMIEMLRVMAEAQNYQIRDNYRLDISAAQSQLAYIRIKHIIYTRQMSELKTYLPTHILNFLINTLNKLLSSLVQQCHKTIMKTYHIEQYLWKIQRQQTLAIIQEKQQYMCFVDWLAINNKFIKSVIQWYVVQCEDMECLVCGFVIKVMDVIGHSSQQIIPDNLLSVLLNKISTSPSIKIYQIQSDPNQQTLLLSYLSLVQAKLYFMGDNQFIAQFKNNTKQLQYIIKEHLMKLICKIIFIHKPSQVTDRLTCVCIRLLEDLYNKVFRTNIIKTTAFVNQVLGAKLRNYRLGAAYDQVNSFIDKFPFIFPLMLRLNKFREFIRESYHSNHYQNHEGSVGNIKIRRGYQFQDAFYRLKDKSLLKHFQVTFINQFGMKEDGVDAGGLIKQFINRVLKAIFDPKRKMFIENNDHELMPHPEKAQSANQIDRQHYQFIGKIIGLALYAGITIGPKFSGPFLNILIGKKNSFWDLKKIDKQLYNSLLYIKDMKEDASDLQLTFQYKDQLRNKYINLKYQGWKIKVTNENKNQYVHLIANYKVNKLLEFQSKHICRGLKKMINREWLYMFNYEELNYLISGSGVINIKELQFYTVYAGYEPHSKTIKYFWEVVEEFDEEQKANLLMFVTSSPRPSFLGFKDLQPPFRIAKTSASKTSLPVAHTCVNVLQLPEYDSRENLEQKLLKAINSDSGYYIA